MKLFMKSFFEQRAREIDTDKVYESLCMTCAGKLGGKPTDWSKGRWRADKCEVCGNQTEVTHSKEFIWRT